MRGVNDVSENYALYELPMKSNSNRLAGMHQRVPERAPVGGHDVLSSEENPIGFLAVDGSLLRRRRRCRRIRRGLARCVRAGVA